MINAADELLPQSSYQLNNLWEVYFEEPDHFTRFHARSTSIPFPLLTTHQRVTGEKHYNGFTPEGEITIEFWETVDWKVYEYFRSWQRRAFRDGAFVSLPESVSKGSSDDSIHRTAFIRFGSFEEDERERIEIVKRELKKELDQQSVEWREFTKGIDETIVQREFDRAVDYGVTTVQKREHSIPTATTVVNKEIIQNILTAFGRRVGQRINDATNRVENIVNRLSGEPAEVQRSLTPPPVQRSTTLLRTPAHFNVAVDTLRADVSGNRRRNENLSQAESSRQETRFKIDAITRSVEKSVFDEQRATFTSRNTKGFQLVNAKVLGFSPISLDYTSSGPLPLSVQFTADRVIESTDGE